MARLPQPWLYAPDHTEPCHAFLPPIYPRHRKPHRSSPELIRPRPTFLPSSSAFADQASAFPSLLHHTIARRTAPHLAQLSPIRIYTRTLPCQHSARQTNPDHLPARPTFLPYFTNTLHLSAILSAPEQASPRRDFLPTFQPSQHLPELAIPLLTNASQAALFSHV